MPREKMRPRVYLSGPLTGGDQRQNVRVAMAEGAKLRDAGWAVLIPHLNWFFEMTHPCAEEVCLEMDFSWVAAADLVLRIPGLSHGGDREVLLARDLKVEVYEGTVDDFLNKWPSASHWASSQGQYSASQRSSL
jgi:hypothetical protein